MSLTVEQQDKKRDLLLNSPVHKIIPRMALPSIISMMVTTFYNLADTFFVSFLGTEATAAVGVNFSLDSLIMTAGSFLAIGANSYIARLLGAKQDHKASQVLSTAFFTSIMTGLFATIAGLLFLDSLVRGLGADESILQYSKDYAGYVLFAAPFMASSLVMNQCLRSEGSPVYSMIGIVSGAVLNIGLDPLFIFSFGWGVKGASAATAISKFVSFSILLMPYLRRSSLLHLSIRHIKYSRDIVSEIVKMGFPSLVRFGLSAASTIVLNNIAISFSDSVLAAVSVVNRVMMFLNAAIIGFCQGFQPVAGYSWGARRFERVYKAYWFSIVAGVSAISVLAIIMAVFAPQIMHLFTATDQEMIRIGVFSIRLQCMALPIFAWVAVVNFSYAALGKAKGAALLSLSRQGICLVPMLLILPRIFGELGLAGAQAAADLLTLLLAVPLNISLLRDIKCRIRAEIS